ncbi:MAG: hypothetical protein WCO78_04695 [Candidatus Roizmanbacteria bacterium]
MENTDAPPQVVSTQNTLDSDKPDISIRPDKEPKILPHLAEYRSLTAYNDEFIINNVKEGDDILVGGGLADGAYLLRSDYSSFEERLKVVTPEKLADYFGQAKNLMEQAPDLDEDTRRLLHTCWRVTRITKNMLGPLASEFARNNSFSRYKAEGEKYCIKPLSRCMNEAVCSEYALMAHHILNKLGIKSSIIVGAFSANPNDHLSDRHTFLVLEDGKYVFDPTHTALGTDCWPPKVFLPDRPLTLENLEDMSVDGNEFGHKMVCTDFLTKEIRKYGSGAS